MNHKSLYPLAATMMLLGKLIIPLGRGSALQKTPEPEVLPEPPPPEKITMRGRKVARPLRWRPVQPASCPR